MAESSLFSQISLDVLLAVIGVLTVALWYWQVMVLKGKAMQNPDGSSDDWHQQKILYGIAFADVFLACPASTSGIILVFVSPQWGYYLLAMVSFWLVWTNMMTTVTSLQFEQPSITLNWFIVYPLGMLVGIAYIIWTIVHFEIIY